MTRTEARELLMQLLFQMEIQNDYSDEIKNKYIDDHFKKDNQLQYALKLSSTVISHLSEIDATLGKSSPKWNTQRMAKVDLAIARLAIGEVLYMEDIPDAVAINEAVDMAKKYSAEDSKKFINGVLGQIVKQKND
ncbi:transcription antitermination factor NusB [Anaerovorax odorimutans]|uniref:Transcription antitermination protein NusB n=1 Tax=Anaerovorax odorimutans TaxID=109327 RepID=A0ABT1RL19_9FIRM|nr:transcription antitermination factor NusB [Anaerovorax odorimutans]MCQ4635885.1 transcription antitermination factor NusB [Anaerovorax odorimutans]